ncbi:MAG: hypothetical protein IT160_10440 [Bryobacterales bacterium]|nr:hypothetical protein [Bryobacterales bacterium]
MAVLALALPASGAPARPGARPWPQSDSFRVLLGVGDTAASSWNGTVRIEGGKLFGLEAMCLAGAEKVDEPKGEWVLSSRPDKVPGSPSESSVPGVHENGVIVSVAGGGPQTKIVIATSQGTFRFSPQDLPWGIRRGYLNGRAVVERVPWVFRITASLNDEYAPAMTQARDNVWVAYVEYTHASSTAPGGDRVWLARYSKSSRTWDAPVPVSPPGERCQRTSAATDARGHVWVFWAADRGGNTDIYARRWSGTAFERELRISNAPGPDLNPVATTDSHGRVWVAWQGWRDNRFQILASVQDVDRFLPERQVSATDGDNWSPAIDAGAGGEVAFAWDTYENGNYDVWMRRAWFLSDSITLHAPIPVTGGLGFEARPSLVHDSQNWIWVAYEVASPRWGKEFGPYLTTGTPLLAGRNVEVKSFKDNMPFVTYHSLAQVLPGPAEDAKGALSQLPDPALAHNRAPGRVPVLPPLPCNTGPRLSADQAGHIFLVYRATGGWHSPAGTVWTEYLHYFNGNRWSGPIAVPHSDGNMDSRPVLLPIGYSKILMIAPGDNRQSAPDANLVQADLYAAEIEIPFRAETALMNSTPVATRIPEPARETSQTSIRNLMRAARVEVGGRKLQLLLGDYHRTTDLALRAGAAGSLDDAYRYFLDAAGLDWASCCDASNGGREFAWWMEQKYSGFFQMADRFVSLYGYQHPGRFPNGSFAILLPNAGERPIAANADSTSLPGYLSKAGGLAIPYQTATDHGTAWETLDPRTEPVVEIAQGARQSYESPGAPRAISPTDAIGGLEPEGFVSRALAKGLKLGFVAGSGPVSTYQAFAGVWAEQPTPKGILEAIRARHVYASSEPVLALVRSGEHLMGDEFQVTGAPVLAVKLSGALPFREVTILRGGQAVYTVHPEAPNIEFEWTDPSPPAQTTSYYYVRAEQSDGNLVWTSPMWITIH